MDTGHNCLLHIGSINMRDRTGNNSEGVQNLDINDHIMLSHSKDLKMYDKDSKEYYFYSKLEHKFKTIIKEL